MARFVANGISSLVRLLHINFSAFVHELSFIDGPRVVHLIIVDMNAYETLSSGDPFGAQDVEGTDGLYNQSVANHTMHLILYLLLGN